MNTRRVSQNTLITVALAGAAFASPETALAQAASLVPFDQFVRQVSAAQTAAYVGPTQASDIASFEEMRQHILSLYSGVKVKHSFLLDDHPYDCVPIDQQPSIRLSEDHTIAEPPPELPAINASAGDTVPATQIDPADAKDALGNARACGEGNIPMRRVTLEDVTAFKTLQDFLQEGSDARAHEVEEPSSDAAAHAKYINTYATQTAANAGVLGDINIWNTHVDTRKTEILREEGFQTNADVGKKYQYIAGGVINFPKRFRTDKTVLYIYWTSLGHGGCYNLSCKGFVQTNKSIPLGGSFASYSKIGGKQLGFTMGALLSKGNWFILTNLTGRLESLGYYPASIFRGGPMANKGAEYFSFGGDTRGVKSWPPLGSGKFPAAGFGKAAIMENLTYFQDANHGVSASVGAVQQSPKCYKATTNNTGGTAAGTYMFFGGPGGKGC